MRLDLLTRPISIAALAALALAGGPVAGEDDAPRGAGAAAGAIEAFASAEIAWEVQLPAAPIAAPLAAGPSGETLVLALPHSIEARAAADGRLAWSRPLAGEGLQRALDPALQPPGVVAWSGVESGAPRLALLSLADGSEVATRLLPAPPAGPPQVGRGDGGTSVWRVPLADGRIHAVSAGLEDAATVQADAPFLPPLLTVAGRPAAFAGEPPRLRVLEGPPVRRAPSGVDPATAAVRGEWLVAAEGRRVCAWRCRSSRRDRLRCRRSWCQEVGADVAAAPAFRGDRVLVVSLDTFVYAFRLDNGHQAWRLSEGQRLSHPPLPWRGLLVVVPEASPRVTAIDPGGPRIVSRLRGAEDETFPVGGSLVGERLVVPVTQPPDRARLRAWDLSPAPEVEDDAAAAR